LNCFDPLGDDDTKMSQWRSRRRFLNFSHHLKREESSTREISRLSNSIATNLARTRAAEYFLLPLSSRHVSSPLSVGANTCYSRISLTIPSQTLPFYPAKPLAHPEHPLENGTSNVYSLLLLFLRLFETGRGYVSGPSEGSRRSTPARANSEGI
jgi:hypothetical protein